ncbi:unannotated protein [freshwater metagenome]|uniref:Unannotated protein n=1 Tax=freshwater metagenome TaxID=449393 RepID=A0A6J7IWL5_9ZZZZ|nr:oxidoreductase [Actinomycetota bacterium]
MATTTPPEGGAYDLVVIGLGSAGLIAAELAQSLGLRVAAVEHGRIGGESLWRGCVPSKALSASAHVAHEMRHADRWGIVPAEPEIDLAGIWERIHQIQEDIAGTGTDPAGLRAAGVDVFHGSAALGDEGVVEVEGGPSLPTRFALLCTGSSPDVPPVAGIEEMGYLSTETIWSASGPPASLLVIGAGRTGCELGQALQRLGVQVTLLEREGRILQRDEPEHAAVVANLLREEGATLETAVQLERAERVAGRAVLHGRTADGAAGRWEADEILVATGRRPNAEGIGLERHGIRVAAHGVVTDGSGRTAVPWIYAVGDLTGRAHFTHLAAAEATRAVRTMFFPGAQRGPMVVPRCLFTDPELAQVGLTEAEARLAHGNDRVRVWRRPLASVDRTRTSSRTAGSIIVVTARGRIVGASVLAPAATELIGELTIAVERRWRLRDLAATIHIYPAVATGLQQIAEEAAIESAHALTPIARLRTRATRRRGAA